MCVPTALLRIEFTAMGAFTRHRVSSYLAFPSLPALADRRSISVALFLGSPPAGVARYPCPAEPGLSSQAGLSPRPRGCPAYLPDYDTGISGKCQILLAAFHQNLPRKASIRFHTPPGAPPTIGPARRGTLFAENPPAPDKPPVPWRSAPRPAGSGPGPWPLEIHHILRLR